MDKSPIYIHHNFTILCSACAGIWGIHGNLWQNHSPPGSDNKACWRETHTQQKKNRIFWIGGQRGIVGSFWRETGFGCLWMTLGNLVHQNLSFHDYKGEVRPSTWSLKMMDISFAGQSLVPLKHSIFKSHDDQANDDIILYPSQRQKITD